MNKEELDCMKNEYEIGLKAIETVTEKLINLAVVENKFIEQVESIKLLNVKFEGIYFRTQFAEEKINNLLEKINKPPQFFIFKWMDKLFIKKYKGA